MAAGSQRVSAVCRRPHRFSLAQWCRCAACRTGSCIAPASAARCGRRRAKSGDKILCVAGGYDFIDRRVHDFLKREARNELQKSAQEYAQALGVRVKRISIRDQSSRWGSCTSAGSLSFSWRLILAPPFVLDYLAAHEVAHLVEMNHSPRFWRVVARDLPLGRARQEVARYLRQRSASLRDRGLTVASRAVIASNPAVIARESGRSSIPETAVLSR